jgi:DNA primase
MIVIDNKIDTKIDTKAVLARVDLLDLIGRDTKLRKVASTRGGEWAGPCPYCRDGDDRFRVQPAQGLWYCRQCSEKWDDAIAYVRKRDGLGFVEACERLAGGSLTTLQSKPQLQPATPAEMEPSAKWRDTAETIVAEATAALWSDAGEKGLAYLHKRGLTDETIRRRELGFNPAWRQVGGKWLEKGVVIPWRVGGQLWHLNIRRATNDPKYRALAGGVPFLYGDDTGSRAVCVLTAGEFDCMLLAQEAGDLVAAASLGSESRHIGGREAARLLPFTSVLVAYDRDAAGEDGAGRLAARYGDFRQIRVPTGKDITEFHQAGGRVRDWIVFELARLEAERSKPKKEPPGPTLQDRAIAAYAQAEAIDVEAAAGELEGHTDEDLERLLVQLQKGNAA